MQDVCDMGGGWVGEGGDDNLMSFFHCRLMAYVKDPETKLTSTAYVLLNPPSVRAQRKD